jgi:hypothetical protein
MIHPGEDIGGRAMNNMRRYLTPWILPLSLMVASGCSLPKGDANAPPSHNSDSISQWLGASHPGQPAGGDQATPLPQPRMMPMNEQISMMSQRIASADDDRKVLASRLHLVETELEEKERALALATREIQESTAQVVKARNDLQQWKKDTKTLRDRFGSMEKENRETMETMIKTLEQILERDNDHGKRADLPLPEPMPMPKRT